MASGFRQRYYLKEDIILMPEGTAHDFNSHKHIAIEELPPWSCNKDMRSRKPVSRKICAFLNTGKGGIVYLGVNEDGTIQGLTLTPYQKDHIRATLWDTLSRYSPPVREHRVKIRCVPVFSKEPSEMELEAINNAQKAIKRESRIRPHMTRNHLACWCDKDAMMQATYGVVHPDYIVEVIVKPWDTENCLDTQDVFTRTKLHPVYTNEEGHVLLYRPALDKDETFDLQGIYTLTENEVKKFYKLQIDELKAKLEQLRTTAWQNIADAECRRE